MCDRCPAGPVDRRAFLKRAAVLGGATAAGGSCCPTWPPVPMGRPWRPSASARTACPCPRSPATGVTRPPKPKASHRAEAADDRDAGAVGRRRVHPDLRAGLRARSAS